jgi:raffinose/stachyose/melibiose transport system substrate-binding protein
MYYYQNFHGEIFNVAHIMFYKTKGNLIEISKYLLFQSEEFMKKLLTAFGIATLSVATLFAQGSQESGSKDSSKPIQLTATVMQSRNVPGLQKMVDKLKTEENIELDIQVVPDAQYDNLIKMKINSGEAPDLIDYNQPQICGVLPPEKYLYDLTDQPWVDKLIAKSNLQWTDGHIYGFPFQALSGFQAMIYNKDAFAKAGITDVPKTPAEFNTVCEKLKAVGIPPVLFPQDSWVPQIFMTAGFAKAEGSDAAATQLSNDLFTAKTTLTDHPELAVVIDDFAKIFKNGYVNEDWLTVSNDENLTRLAKAEGGMLFGNGLSMVANMIHQFPDTNLGLFNYPASYSEDLLALTPASIGFSVYKDTKNAEACLKVLNLFATPEYGNLWYTDGRDSFPALKGMDGGSVPAISSALYNEYVPSGKYVAEMNSHWTAIQPLFKSTLWIYYQEAAQGKYDGATLLSKFQLDINKLLKSRNTPGFN